MNFLRIGWTVLLLFQADPDLEELLRLQRYADAVRSAASADALLQAASKLENEDAVKAIVREVAQLRGVLRKPEPAARWLLRLSDRRGGSEECLVAAGYLLLVAGRYDESVRVVESALRMRESGLAYAYLAEAHRRAGREGEARAALKKALAAADAPRKFVSDCALALAASLRSRGDRAYVELLVEAGLSLRAAVWLADEIPFASPGDQPRLRRRAVDLFKRALDDRTPAATWWQAARLADGDQRFEWLVQAVRRGEDVLGDEGHACPGALLDLARECLRRKRYVAAADLARRRLAVGSSVAAWELLESIPLGAHARR